MTEVLTPQKLASLISTEISLCDNETGSEIQQNSTDAYNYLLMKPKGDEENGRSQVQDGAVADVIDAVMAELQPMYSVDELIEVKAEGPDDEDRAKADTKALNWYFRERARGYERLDEGVQDALLLRNGYIKVWPEQSWRLPYETILEGTVDQIDAELAQLANDGAQIKELDRVVLQAAEYVSDYSYAPDGITVEETSLLVSPQIERVEVQVIRRAKEVKVQTIAREDIGVSRDSWDQNLQSPRFSYHRRWMTRNEAMSLGFYEGDIKAVSAVDTFNTQTKIEREEGSRKVNDTHAADTGGDIINIFECYYKIDADDDGIAELHQIFYAETNRILRWAAPDGEPGPYADQIVSVVPTAAGAALRVAHRHQGRSLFDKERSTEDVKRTLKRQMLDNLYDANDQEFIIGPGASEDDFELGFSGGYKRCRNPQTDAVPVPHQPIINESLAALQYMDSVRSERGGAALDNANQQKPTNIQASTFERWMTATERTTAMYVRNLANTLIRDVFVLLHMQLRALGEPFDYQDGDEWKVAEPRFWIERNRFSVKLGKSEGEKARLVAGYDKQIAYAAEAMQSEGDGIVTDWSQIYEMLTDQANLMGVENHWLDPDRPSGQINPQTGEPVSVADAARMSRAQAAQQAQQAQQAHMDKLLSAQMQATAAQEETKRVSDQMEAQQKTLDTILDYIAKMTKIEADTGQDVQGGVLYGDDNAPAVTQ